MTRAERLLAQAEVHAANLLDTLNALRIQQEADKAHAELVKLDEALERKAEVHDGE